MNWNAVQSGLVTRVCCGGRVAALFRMELWGACRMGGTVLFGLVMKAFPWRVAGGHVVSCHVMSCHVMSCHVMSCHVMSCHVMSCHVTSSGHVLGGPKRGGKKCIRTTSFLTHVAWRLCQCYREAVRS